MGSSVELRVYNAGSGAGSSGGIALAPHTSIFVCGWEVEYNEDGVHITSGFRTERLITTKRLGTTQKTWDSIKEYSQQLGTGRIPEYANFAPGMFLAVVGGLAAMAFKLWSGR